MADRFKNDRRLTHDWCHSWKVSIRPCRISATSTHVRLEVVNSPELMKAEGMKMMMEARMTNQWCPMPDSLSSAKPSFLHLTATPWI